MCPNNNITYRDKYCDEEADLRMLDLKSNPLIRPVLLMFNTNYFLSDPIPSNIQAGQGVGWI